jgi:hypothetical protein
MPSTIITLEEIRQLADAENRALLDWDDRPGEYDANDEPLPDVPDDRYWIPLSRWMEGYDPEVLPRASQAMQALSTAFQDFNNSGREMPSTEFWAIRKAAYVACSEKPPRPRFEASVAELDKQHVRDYQICKMWEMMTPSGLPDFDLLEQERRQPGSVIDDAWRQRMADKQIAELGWGPRSLPSESKAVRQRKPPEASIEDLLRSGCNIEQVVRIKTREYGVDKIETNGIDLRKMVMAIALCLDIDAPLNAQGQLNQAGNDGIAARCGQDVADAEVNRPTPRMEPFEYDPNAEPEDVIDPTVPTKAREQRVAELFAEGNDADAIALEAGVPIGRVKAIISMQQDKAINESAMDDE